MWWAELIGYAGALCTLATFSMKTMVPLRYLGIASNVLFIAYGLLLPAYPVAALHVVLLPMNIVRLWQMKRLIEQVRIASAGDADMDWLKPFMNKRRIVAGATLFRKDDPATELFYLLSGGLRLVEGGIDLHAGEIIGELGMIEPHHRRSFTAECSETAEMLVISYDQVRELYFQNPSFGFYFLNLSARRLFNNLARSESKIAELQAAPSGAAAVDRATIPALTPVSA